MAARSLRAVGLAVTMVSMVTLSTVVYTAVVDYQGFLSGLRPGAQGSAVSGNAVLQGSTLLLSLNVTAQNKGLYPISISMSCSAGQQNGATCQPTQTTIRPGGESTLRFHISVPDGSQYVSGSSILHVNGSVTVGLEPFASFSEIVDFGALFKLGGS